MAEKRCCVCKQIKPLSEFYKHCNRKDGHQTYCKICDKIRKREYEHTPKVKKRIKKYRQSKKGKESLRKSCKKYKQSKKGKANSRRYARQYYKKYPERNIAKAAVYRAIKNGKLISPKKLNCTYCPRQAQAYHHYLGYAKEHWLDVEPICASCHTLIHISIL